MYAATGAMWLSSLLAMLVPLVLGGSERVHPKTKERVLATPDPIVGYILITLRFTCMMAFYGSTLAVIYSIFSFESPAGVAATLPVSPTVRCVVNLTCQFFFVYFMMTV